VDPESLLVLAVTHPLEAKATRAGSRTTVAVAGFLGLMVGVLLAFFLHYLRQVRLKERGAGG